MMDLTGMTDIELVQLQAELRKYPEDKEELYQVLVELGRRQSKNTALLAAAVHLSVSTREEETEI